MLIFGVLDIGFGTDFFDGAEYLDNQHAVMRYDCAATFADDVRMRHPLGIADLGDIVDDVVRVFLQRVIGGAVER